MLLSAAFRIGVARCEAERGLQSACANKALRLASRSVNMPTGIRASEPSRTGAATSAALWVGVSSKIFRNCGAKALIKPQAAKHRANETVPKVFDFLQQKRIKPLIAQRFPLAEARHAHELLGKGGVTGKIVLVRNGSSPESGAA